MSEEVFLLTNLPSDLYLNDFPRAIQDDGKVELGGGFSPISKLPTSTLRPQVRQLAPGTMSKTQ